MFLGFSSWWELLAKRCYGKPCLVSCTNRAALLSLDAVPGHQARVSVPDKGNWSAPVFTPAESGQMMHMDRLCILEGLEEVIAKGMKAVKGWKMASLYIQDEGSGALLSAGPICRWSTVKLCGHLQLLNLNRQSMV